MQTLYFTKQFTAGTLKGLQHTSKLSFASVESAMDWVKLVKKYSKRNGWELVDYSFQNYAR
jgi:hypothetical protein